MKTNDLNVITHDSQVDRRTKQKGAEDPSLRTPDGAPLAPPCVMVIFGGAGDLTKRLVIPALYNLVGAQRLPDEFRIVGVDLASKTTDNWRTGLTETIQSFVGSDGESALDQLDSKAWQWLTDRMSYVQGDLNDAQTYKRLNDHLSELDKTAGTSGNRLFYLAIADRFFKVAVEGLGAGGLLAEKDGEWRRVIIEKPFGHDLDSAKALNAAILKHLQEPHVAPDSNTETYISCKLQIDNWRWAGVPFYLRTGKYLKRRVTEIAIRVHQAPFTLFRDTNVERMHPNWMILRIQPGEGIGLEFAAKRPGPTMKLSNVALDFAYEDYFKTAPNTGYETLIYDCMIGDATLFQRADNIEAGWAAVQPILDRWGNNLQSSFPHYTAGSDGPAAADELLARDARAWRPFLDLTNHQRAA